MGFLLQEDLCDCPQKDNNQILVQVESTVGMGTGVLT